MWKISKQLLIREGKEKIGALHDALHQHAVIILLQMYIGIYFPCRNRFSRFFLDHPYLKAFFFFFGINLS